MCIRDRNICAYWLLYVSLCPPSASSTSTPHAAYCSRSVMLYLNSVFTASSAFGSSLNVILPISLTSSVWLRLIRHNTLSSAFPTFPSRLSAVLVLFPYTTPDVYKRQGSNSHKKFNSVRTTLASFLKRSVSFSVKFTRR